MGTEKDNTKVFHTLVDKSSVVVPEDTIILLVGECKTAPNPVIYGSIDELFKD